MFCTEEQKELFIRECETERIAKALADARRFRTIAGQKSIRKEKSGMFSEKNVKNSTNNLLFHLQYVYICNMLRVVEHLEHLLRVHDCIILPQLGGFVLQTVPASYVMEEHLFRPGHKEVVFNPSLTHNDGLLAEQYMNVYNVTFQKARRMVEEDAEDIKTTLLKGLNVSLGNIGTLCRGEEGQIVFRAGDTEVFCVDLYGLAPFRLETWQAMQDKATPLPAANEKRNIFYIPVNRNIVRGIASTAAAVALFLMISTPVKEINPSSYTASFIPSEIVKTNKNITEDAPAPATPARTPRSIAPSAAKPKPGNAARIEKKEVLPEYYVVISSVKTMKQAEEVMSKTNRQAMKKAGRLHADDKIRIYADKFTDKKKAELYLADIRKHSEYKDAWLYTRNK